MKVLVCGGRDYNNKEHVFNVLDRFHEGTKITTLVHGLAVGVDVLAGQWAEMHDIPVQEFPADWDKYGKAAGFIRNQQMLDESCPEYVIAFPGGVGTKNMVDLALRAGVSVCSVEGLC